MYERGSRTPIYVTGKVFDADGEPITAGVTAYVFDAALSATEGLGVLTHVRNGVWAYTPAEGETDEAILGVEFYHPDAFALGPFTPLVPGVDPRSLATADDVTITPVAATVSTGEVAETDLVCYQHAAAAFAFGVVDSAGTPIDLSGLDLAFLLYDQEDPDEAIVELVTPTQITVSGDGSATATVAITPTETAAARGLRYRLLDATNDRELCRGVFEIRSGPATS